jgi:hypothetical protein
MDMRAHRARADKAWQNRLVWDTVLKDAYRFTMPYRMAGDLGEAQARTDHLFDNTGITSTFRGAGQLKEDLFPTGQPFFRLKPGPISRAVFNTERKKIKAQQQAETDGPPGIGDNGGPPLDDPDSPSEIKMERELDSITEQIAPFFASGAWDIASADMCLDLYAGTAIMLVLKGNQQNPIKFVTLPIEQCAIELGPHGEVVALFWRSKMTRRQISTAFPNGKFTKEFNDNLQKTPDGEVDLCQDFWRDDKAQKPWSFAAWLKGEGDAQEPIASENYKTQPFIAPMFYRVPGEHMGRGPVLLALPTIKTLNKAMELTLKSAAIQMLGIWGYRPGGTFNPDTARLAPGQFWPMASTGGVMGPDVTRLDVSAGKLDVSQLVTNELRMQVKAALHDMELPDAGLTPKSAAEIMARMSQRKANWVGAFGRMINSINPVVPRVMEILHDLGLLVTNVKIDQLLVSVESVSPMAMALKADAYRTTMDAIMLVAQLEGPQGVARRFKIDKLLRRMIRDLGVDSDMVRSLTELKAFDAQAAQAAQAQQLAAAAMNKPKDFAEVMGAMPDQQQQTSEAPALAG